MKRFLILFLTIILTNCSNDVQFNTPAVQADKNYKLWRANYFDAVVDDAGVLILKSGNILETLTMTLPSLKETTYNLSDKSAAVITFVDEENITYSTRNSPTIEDQNFPEIGTIKITKIDGNTFSGDFRFVAFTADGKNAVGFNNGIIYQVPFR